MKCKHCKTQNKKDYVYCKKCGKRSPRFEKLVNSVNNKQSLI